VVPFDFSQLFADAVGVAPAEALPQEDKGKEDAKESRAEKPEQPEKAEARDVVQLLGLPAPVPQVPVSEPQEVKGKPAEQIAAVAPEKPQAKADKPVAQEKELPKEHAAPEIILPEARKDSKPAPAGDELRMLAQAHASQGSQAAQAARPVVPVAAPVGTAQWREEFSAAVRVIATEQIQSAEIHLNPPELGPVQVSLRMDAREASFAFTAPHADTRQALEAALPRLRELLEAGGISLGSASVDISGSGAFGRDAPRDPGAEPGNPRAGLRDPAAAEPETVVLAPVRSPRLLDVFA
jgi:flagellar hook-length control protein FliK